MFNDCKLCIHDEVCRFKDKYISAKREIFVTTFQFSLLCKKFKESVNPNNQGTTSTETPYEIMNHNLGETLSTIETKTIPNNNETTYNPEICEVLKDRGDV